MSSVAVDSDILAEVADALTELQDDLLSYEQRAARPVDRAERETLRLVMRRMHNLKGKLQLAARPQSAALVHQAESLIAEHFETEQTLTRELLDFLFDTHDALVESVTSRSEPFARIDVMLQRSDELRLDNLPALGRPRFPFPVTSEEYARSIAAERDGYQVVCIEKAIRGDISRQTFDQLPIRQDVAELGELLAYRPAFDEIDRSRHETILVLVAITKLSSEELAERLFDPWKICSWPTAVQEAEPSSEALSSNHVQTVHRPPRILIADDDATSRLILSELLKNVGETQTASDGRQAATLLESALATGAAFDLVCLDIMMPFEDGLSVLRRLRSAETAHRVAEKARAKVIMTTALGDYQHFHHAFVEDCDSYLVKPITRQALERQLKRLGLEHAQATAST